MISYYSNQPYIDYNNDHNDHLMMIMMMMMRLTKMMTIAMMTTMAFDPTVVKKQLWTGEGSASLIHDLTCVFVPCLHDDVDNDDDVVLDDDDVAFHDYFIFVLGKLHCLKI